jgi:tetratricopeptide (TPR) repeat protein
MKLKRTKLAGLVFALASFAGLSIVPLVAAAQDQPAAAAPKYTRPEYDAYQAAAAEKSPQQKIKLLDDFVAKYPTSELLVNVYAEYVKAYQETHNWAKLIDTYDKFLALPNIDANARVTALFSRAQTFEFAYNPKDPNAKEQLLKARAAAQEGLKSVDKVTKPANATDEQFATTKKAITVQFYNTDGFAALQQKDYKAAIEAFRAALALDPKQPTTAYRLGLAYLQQEPPQALNGFWAVAQAINLKIPDEARVQKYLRQQILRYENPSCEKEIDAQVKELLSLAATAPEPPPSYSIPSRADLDKVLQGSTIVTVLADLKAGGAKGKLTWLAVCSGKFPEVLAKAYEVVPGADSVVIKAYVGTTQEEIDASTAPNAELKVTGQPDASRIEKGGVFRFGGALVDYTPDPYLIKWDEVKINEEDIPKGTAKKPAKTGKTGKAPAKRPAKKRPS